MNKTQVIISNRIAKDGEVRLGSSAIILDQTREKILLTQRSDNFQWCLPGGRLESGENISEACVREVFEETGLYVEIVQLIGIYSDADKLVIYPDGNKTHIISICFEVKVIDGKALISDETLDLGFFGQNDFSALDLFPGHLERIEDFFKGSFPVIK